MCSNKTTAEMNLALLQFQKWYLHSRVEPWSCSEIAISIWIQDDILTLLLPPQEAFFLTSGDWIEDASSESTENKSFWKKIPLASQLCWNSFLFLNVDSKHYTILKFLPVYCDGGGWTWGNKITSWRCSGIVQHQQKFCTATENCIMR